MSFLQFCPGAHDAIRFKRTWLKGDYDHVKIPKKEFDLFDEAIREMNTHYPSAGEFISEQIKARYRNTKSGKRLLQKIEKP